MTNIEKLDYLKMQQDAVENSINMLFDIHVDIIKDVVDILDEEERLNNLVNFCNTGKYIEEVLKPEDLYNFDFNQEWLDIFFK